MMFGIAVSLKSGLLGLQHMQHQAAELSPPHNMYRAPGLHRILHWQHGSISIVPGSGAFP